MPLHDPQAEGGPEGKKNILVDVRMTQPMRTLPRRRPLGTTAKPQILPQYIDRQFVTGTEKTYEPLPALAHGRPAVGG